MQPSKQDLLAPFDPTGYLSITGAQLLQLISGAAPYIDTGLNVYTVDTGSVANVPDASTTTKWKRYLWIRISTSSTSVYVWNDNVPALTPSFLNWTSLSTAGIGAGSIVNAMIADNTIQDIKIANLSYSKLTGAPSGLPPSGAAGGVLTGTFPNPGLADNSVTTTKINDASITTTKIADKNVTVAKILGSGVALTMIRSTVADATLTEFFTPPILFTGLNETTIAVNQLKQVQVNAAGTSYQYSSNNVINTSLFTFATVGTTVGTLANTTSTPLYNSTGMTSMFNTGLFTPISTTLTKLFIEVDVTISSQATGGIFVGLYNAIGATVALAGKGFINGNAALNATTFSVRFSYLSGTGVAAATYYLMIGNSATPASATWNSVDGINNPFLITKSSIKITEIL